MEEVNKDPGPYMAQILKVPVRIFLEGKIRLTKAIAEAWDIPEDKILGSTEVIDMKGKYSPRSMPWARIKTPGERKVEYVNARKFYFYVMIELKNYSLKDLRKITGRKIGSMKYYCQKAKQHMELEKDYMNKARLVLHHIENNLVIFPEPIITFEAHATVIKGGGANENPPDVSLSGLDSETPDEKNPQVED
jgi:hypothetical protein